MIIEIEDKKRPPKKGEMYILVGEKEIVGISEISYKDWQAVIIKRIIEEPAKSMENYVQYGWMQT